MRAIKSLLGVIGITVVLIAVRAQLAPKYLAHFDSINFALALEQFSPAQHQPQPPGYPLFVLLTRLIHLITRSPEMTFLLAGVIGSVVAALVLRRLATRMFDRSTGNVAAALFLCQPVLLLSGITSPVRTFLAVGSVVVASLVWSAWPAGSSVRLFYGAAAALGIAGGFRPELLPGLLPLLAIGGVHSRRSARQLVVAAAVLGCAVLPWVVWTVAAAGGTERFLLILGDYSSVQFRTTSLLYGADRDAAVLNVWRVLLWNGLAVLPWIWAGPVLLRRRLLPGMFLAAWLIPPFLLQAFVHTADADHTLALAPGLCLIGAAILRAAAERVRVPVWLPSSAAAAASAALFFLPVAPVPGAATLTSVREASRLTEIVLRGLDNIGDDGSLVLLADDTVAVWRHASYYHPNAETLILNGTLDRGGHSGRHLAVRQHAMKVANVADTIEVAAGARVVVLAQTADEMRTALSRNVDLRFIGGLWSFRMPRAAQFRWGAYTYRSSASPMQSASMRYPPPTN